MFNPSKRIRRLAALPVLVAAALMLPMAAPGHAGTVPETIGAGVSTGFVHSANATSTMCQASDGYTFQGVAIAGATLGHNDDPLVGSTGFVNQPTGGATSDPLNGTPLGCTDGSLWDTLNGVVPDGGQVPIVGCPTARSTCDVPPGASNMSNVLADEGTVGGANAGSFNCNGSPTSLPNLPATKKISCNLKGTFVRFGGAVLVSLRGCVDVINATAEAACSGDTEDVLLAAQVVPVPLQTDCATPFILGSSCTALTGPYVVTPVNATSAINPALDVLYCPLETGRSDPPDCL